MSCSGVPAQRAVRAFAHLCELNHAVDANEDEADDNGSHGHPERIATQPLGAFYIPLVVTVQSLQRGNREFTALPLKQKPVGKAA